MEQRIADRRRDFKKSFEDPRRQREELQVQIRKSGRDDFLAKKRAQAVGTVTVPSVIDENATVMSPRSGSVSVRELAGYHKPMLETGTAEQRLEIAQSLRKMLSADKSPPIQQIIDAGLVPILVKCLRCYDEPSLQFEAAWALTNVASGDTQQTQAVISNGAVPCFVDLLNHTHEDIREQAVWALGNIAGDSAPFRDIVLGCGALPFILDMIRALCPPNNPHPHMDTKAEELRWSILRNATWALSNFCRGKPPPNFEIVMPTLSVLGPLVTLDDHEILTDACWALSYLSDGSKERIEALIQTNVLPRVVELMSHPSGHVQTPALRTVGNVATGTDEQTNQLLRLGAIPRLRDMLASPRKTIRKEACWTLSNITAGTWEQVQAVIDAGIIPILLELIQTAEYEIKREATWAVANAASGGKPEQVMQLVSDGCIKPLCMLLTIGEARVVQIILESIENILKVGKMREQAESLPANPYVQAIEEADGMPAIEQLQESNNEKIYHKAVSIIYNYFPHEEEQVDVLSNINPVFGLDHQQTTNFDFARAG